MRITAADHLGTAVKDAVLPLMNGVPGRMEFRFRPAVTGLVDTTSFPTVLFFTAVKEFLALWLLCGRGAVGGKAYNRRQELPEEAAKWADLMIYTTEDCNMEDPAVICLQMAEAARGARAQDYPLTASRCHLRGSSQLMTTSPGAGVSAIK